MNCWSHTLHAAPRELARQVICVSQRNSTIDATHDKDWHILHLNCIHLRHTPKLIKYYSKTVHAILELQFTERPPCYPNTTAERSNT